ncbi:MAG: hypothetical protein A2X81_13165 [Desulfobacterales bacterium GWB2_56_26]|nr:MAG: hypothetical protein A2X81_13165 [Desulfobacterales bacterium GWB2_56_26]
MPKITGTLLTFKGQQKAAISNEEGAVTEVQRRERDKRRFVEDGYNNGGKGRDRVLSCTERPHQMVIAHDRPNCRNSLGLAGIATAKTAVTMQGARPGCDLRSRHIPFFISYGAAGMGRGRVRHGGRTLAGFRLGDGKKEEKKQQIRNE